MSEYAIEVRNLRKTYKLYSSNKRRIIEGLFPHVKPQYKEFHALDGVDFKIRKGEIVGIIGKNGSGKSTLLKIITGVLNPTEGEVIVNGRISALLELGAGFNPEYTGIENIYLNGTLNQLTREEVDKRIDDIANFADIGDFINQPVKNYSSGMFVRLAFAVAVYSDPDILIVDEALAVGDAAFQAKCMARMNQIMKSGATVLFVTHDMNTVKRLCQRCIYLENGVKIMEGPAEELADVYLKRVRASMNEEHSKVYDKNHHEMITKVKEVEELSNGSSYKDEEFIKRTKLFREGNGDIEFWSIKLLNEKNESTKSFAFDQIMKIRVTFVLKKELEFAVAYHIKDDKNMEILGSSSLRELGYLIKGKKGEIFEVEFITKLPLIEGNYNIMLVASAPIIRNRSAIFFALIENAEIFSVEENVDYKLWDKLYIQNEFTITKIGNG